MVVNVPQTAFEILSVFVYCFVLFVICTSRQKVFKTTFYLIFVATGIADVVSIFVNSYLVIQGELVLGPDYQHIASFCVVTSGYTFVMHMIGNLTIAFNRYSAICLAEHYDKNLIAIAAVANTIGAKMTYVREPDGSYTFTGLETHLDTVNRFIYFGVCLVYAVISAILNVLLIYKFHRLSRSNEHIKHGHHEKRLFLYSLIVFAFCLLMCAQQIGKVFVIFSGNYDSFLWITMQFFWINDVMVSIPPYSLLVLCSHLRRDSMGLLLCKWRQSGILPASSSKTPATERKALSTIRVTK
ncbi:hypothetical protein Y032_0002g1059 [Ancylostoma ceylanicum]|uniref:Serpentine receptor class gamma n=1 Tax=Ancylostoma ceylanicum TaxID=53326 RepID=A0A016W130_9BILA|nr:hypothetical protein Y032_0002g1059 [Ancylostoma ceylanicum]